MAGFSLLAAVTLSSAFGVARIEPYGGVVSSWRPAGGEEVFAMAKPYDSCKKGVQIHGGLPLCWPWFINEGPKGARIHGITRYLDWKVSESSPNRAVLELDCTAQSRELWPYAFHAELVYELGEQSLAVTFSVTNADSRAFRCTEGFHPYFRVGDTWRCSVDGVDGLHYCRKTEPKFGESRRWQGVFSGSEFSPGGKGGVVFTGDDLCHRLTDPVLGRTIDIRYTGSIKSLIWNSGADFAPFGGSDDPGFGRRFICVEGGTAYRDRAYLLEPGSRHTLKVELRCRRLFVNPSENTSR